MKLYVALWTNGTYAAAPHWINSMHGNNICVQLDNLNLNNLYTLNNAALFLEKTEAESWLTSLSESDGLNVEIVEVIL